MKKDSIILLYMISVMVSIVVIEAYMFVFNVKYAYADGYGTTEVDGIIWEYEVSEEGEAINVCPVTPLEGIVEIPEELDGHVVRTLKFYIDAQEQPDLIEITIPRSVTNILGEDEDWNINFSNLEKIHVSRDNNYFYSGEDGVLFNKNKTKLISYPKGKTEEGYIIPEGTISVHGFFNNNLKTINVPQSVEYIGGIVRCLSLEKIIVDNNNSNFCDIEGVLFSKDMTEIVRYPSNKKNGDNIEEEYIIPETVDYINEYAFENCHNLKGINIPNGLLNIGRSAFKECDNLLSIKIPDGVSRIENGTFSYCSALKSIDMNNQINYIGNFAFLGCEALDEFEMPQNIIYIGESAFWSCSNIQQLDLSDSLAYIGGEAFAYCSSLKEINIPSSVEYIGELAFRCCDNLIQITVENNNQYYTSEEGVLFNKDKTELIQYPIGNLRTNYTIPDGVEIIKKDAFLGSEYLKVTNIPYSIEEIEEDGGFYNSGIEQFIVNENNIVYSSDEGVLFNKTKSILIKYPCKKKDEKYIIPDEVLVIADETFTNNYELKKLIIKDGVINIEGDPFYCADNITIYTNNDYIAGFLEENNYYDEDDGSFYGTPYILDKQPPVITNIKYRTSSQNRDDVVVTITAEDDTIADAAYSFDGGITWQESNEHTYARSSGNVVIKVRDEFGYTTSKEIDVSTLEELEIDFGKYKEEQDEIKKYVTRIEALTTLEEFVSEITTNGNVVIKDGDNVVYDTKENIINKNAQMKTGMSITISLNDQIAKYIAVVTGDLNGDGKADDIDLLKMARYMANLDNNLKDEYLRAANVFEDNDYADDKDLLKLARMLVGLK